MQKIAIMALAILASACSEAPAPTPTTAELVETAEAAGLGTYAQALEREAQEKREKLAKDIGTAVHSQVDSAQEELDSKLTTQK